MFLRIQWSQDKESGASEELIYLLNIFAQEKKKNNKTTISHFHIGRWYHVHVFSSITSIVDKLTSEPIDQNMPHHVTNIKLVGSSLLEHCTSDRIVGKTFGANFYRLNSITFTGNWRLWNKQKIFCFFTVQIWLHLQQTEDFGIHRKSSACLVQKSLRFLT